METYPTRKVSQQRQQRELGYTIAHARLALGLSQDEVAEHTGLTRWTIIHAETGRGLTTRTLFFILDALGLRIELKPARSMDESERLTAAAMKLSRALDDYEGRR